MEAEMPVVLILKSTHTHFYWKRSDTKVFSIPLLYVPTREVFLHETLCDLEHIAVQARVRLRLEPDHLLCHGLPSPLQAHRESEHDKNMWLLG